VGNCCLCTWESRFMEQMRDESETNESELQCVGVWLLIKERGRISSESVEQKGKLLILSLL